MVYSVVGLDRSAFDLFGASLNRNVEVTTYQSGSPMFQMDVGGPVLDPVWLRTIQGIDLTLHGQFVDHLSSYEFRRPQGSCRVEALMLRVADPFAEDRVGVPVTLWLPFRAGRRAEIIPRGATLNRPIVRFVDAT